MERNVLLLADWCGMDSKVVYHTKGSFDIFFGFWTLYLVNSLNAPIIKLHTITSESPINVICSTHISYLLLFRFKLVALILSITLCIILSCSYVHPQIRMSSVKTRTPSRPSMILLIVLWKISGLELIPYGILFTLYLPYGVVTVHNMVLASSNCI